MIAARHDTTIGLAVIPALLRSDLATFLRFERNNFYPMCHGWKHINFGEDGNPNEFGTSRPFRSAFIDATSALQTFRGRFPDIPAVFVPPFNRIAPEISDSLSDIGFVGLSAAPRPIERRVARLITRFGWLRGFDIASKGRLRRIDTQVDLIDWQSASANDLAEVCDMLLGQLRLRRNGFLPLGTPIGLLIHHLVHNEHIWNLFERMILLIKDDLGCRIRRCRAHVFACGACFNRRGHNRLSHVGRGCGTGQARINDARLRPLHSILNTRSVRRPRLCAEREPIVLRT